MSNAEKQSLIASIDYLAERIAEERGAEVVESIFSFYGVSDLESLSEGDLWNIYGDLHQIDAD